MPLLALFWFMLVRMKGRTQREKNKGALCAVLCIGVRPLCSIMSTKDNGNFAPLFFLVLAACRTINWECRRQQYPTYLPTYLGGGGRYRCFKYLPMIASALIDLLPPFFHTRFFKNGDIRAPDPPLVLTITIHPTGLVDILTFRAIPLHSDHV